MLLRNGTISSMLKHPDLIVIGGGLTGMEAAWQTAQHGDYINYPFTIAEYGRFFDTLLSAECIDLRTFETEIKRGVDAGAGISWMAACHWKSLPAVAARRCPLGRCSRPEWLNRTQAAGFTQLLNGVEGYLGNIATGLLTGINAVQILQRIILSPFPTQSCWRHFAITSPMQV